MKRFRLICIGVALLIAIGCVCSCCTAETNAQSNNPGYSIQTVYTDNLGITRIYKVHTPNGSYTVARFGRSGAVILERHENK